MKQLMDMLLHNQLTNAQLIRLTGNQDLKLLAMEWVNIHDIDKTISF